MGTLVTWLAVAALAVLGALVIHLLNVQHERRIAAFRYGRNVPDNRERASWADRSDRNWSLMRLLPRWYLRRTTHVHQADQDGAQPQAHPWSRHRT